MSISLKVPRERPAAPGGPEPRILGRSFPHDDAAAHIRGTAAFMPDDWTVEEYTRQVEQQRAQGFTRAPLRTPEQVVADLVGVRVEPFRVRLEGFGEGAQSFDWVVAPLPDPPPGTATIGEQ